MFGEVQQVALFTTLGLNRNDMKVYLHLTGFLHLILTRTLDSEKGPSTEGV